MTALRILKRRKEIHDNTAARELCQIMFADLEESPNNRTELKSLQTADTGKKIKFTKFLKNQVKFIQGIKKG